MMDAICLFGLRFGCFFMTVSFLKDGAFDASFVVLGIRCPPTNGKRRPVRSCEDKRAMKNDLCRCEQTPMMMMIRESSKFGKIHRFHSLVDSRQRPGSDCPAPPCVTPHHASPIHTHGFAPPKLLFHPVGACRFHLSLCPRSSRKEERTNERTNERKNE